MYGEPQFVYRPSEFIDSCNEAFDSVFPAVIIEGEVANFRLSRNKWVYFDLIDEHATVKFFGTAFGPQRQLADGMQVRVLGVPRLSAQYGFSITIKGVELLGTGSLQQAAAQLAAQLEREGLFAQERKRSLPLSPQRIGLITSAESAAYSDFIKIANERSGGLQIILVDVPVQGVEAPERIAQAIARLNSLEEPVEVLVITRGGGSAEDLQAFNAEQVVRAVATSRTPTLVAIGHERDMSLSELAADWRASTPSNAAERITLDRRERLRQLDQLALDLREGLLRQIVQREQQLEVIQRDLLEHITERVELHWQRYAEAQRFIAACNPMSVLANGYAMVRATSGRLLTSAAQVNQESAINMVFHDGAVRAIIEKE
jgi:exodeoxyribonuclease VII large subunit